jgi:diguanylate cyclase (GGDEF)-like protein
VIPIDRQRKRLFIVLALLLLAAFVTTLLLSYFIARATIRTNIIEQELPLTGDSIYSEIQRDVIKPVFVSDQMAHNTFMRDWVLGGQRDTTQLTRYLKEVKERYGAITAFFASEATFRYYNHDGYQLTLRADEPRDQWFMRVRQMKDAYESNIDSDKTNKDAITVFINYRILDDKQNFLGATGIGLSSNGLSNLIKQYEQKFQRQIAFANRDGNLMLVNTDRQGKGPSIREMPGLKTIAPQILNGSPIQTKLSYASDSNGSSLTHVNSRFIPELNWYLIVQQNEAQMLSPLARVLWLNALIALLATVAAIALVWFAVNRYQRRLEMMATTDALTGLANRSTGELAFQRAIDNAQKHREPFCVLVIDIDRFKEINDAYGHQTGDSVIKEFGCRLQTLVRAGDLIARWGGEEFLVILSRCEIDDGLRRAQAIREAIAATPFAVSHAIVDGTSRQEASSYRSTASFGLAQWQENETSDSLFARADRALIDAKRNGRDRIEIAT